MSAEQREPVKGLPDGALQGWLTDARPGLVLNEEGSLELWMLLEVSVAAGWGPEEFTLAVRPLEGADPYRFAAELTGAADAVVLQEGRKLQVDRQVLAEHKRRARLEQRQIREAMVEVAVEASSCEFCQRPVSFVVEGTRLCKRHAEELGVRPHGKVGEPEPVEEPES